MSLNGTVSQRAMARQNILGRSRDLLLCVVVGVAIVAVTVLLGLFTRIDPHLLFKWLGFAAMTALVFGDTIRLNRHRWGRPRFWLLLGAFFAVQCGLGIIILGTVTKVPTIIWMFLIPLDYIALGAYLGVFFELRRN